MEFLLYTIERFRGSSLHNEFEVSLKRVPLVASFPSIVIRKVFLMLSCISSDTMW